MNFTLGELPVNKPHFFSVFYHFLSNSFAKVIIYQKYHQIILNTTVTLINTDRAGNGHIRLQIATQQLMKYICG